MNNPELHTQLSDALHLITRWASPVAGHDVSLSSDGLAVAYESDPDVGGWSGVADVARADFGLLLMALLSTDAVAHLQQTLRTAITFVEAGHLDDPAVRLGERTAYQIQRIANTVVQPRPQPAEVEAVFERYLQPGRPPMPDIDTNFVGEDRDELRDSIVRRFGQPAS
ncbi:hypothetical protein ACWGJ9_11465 [Curtobacterium citreum]